MQLKNRKYLSSLGPQLGQYFNVFSTTCFSIKANSNCVTVQVLLYSKPCFICLLTSKLTFLEN